LQVITVYVVPADKSFREASRINLVDLWTDAADPVSLLRFSFPEKLTAFLFEKINTQH
jgi:hypothetical protein